jgi:hypothetical protein
VVLLCLFSAGHSTPRACQSFTVTGNLRAGEHFEIPLGGGLTFRLDPEHFGPKGDIDGWSMKVVPEQHTSDDYIYPLNPPLRFNGLQLLGPIYGESTESSLGRPHQALFLLSQSDADRILPLVNNALWPYSAPHPDKAVDEYLEALKRLITGQLNLTVKSYDADPNSGSIRKIAFQVEFNLPVEFRLDPALKPALAECSRYGQ